MLNPDDTVIHGMSRCPVLLYLANKRAEDRIYLTIYSHICHLWVMCYCQTCKSVMRYITNAVMFPPPLMLLEYFQCHTMENTSYIKCRVIFLFDGWAVGLSKSVSQLVSLTLYYHAKGIYDMLVCVSFHIDFSKNFPKCYSVLFKATHIVKNGALKKCKCKSIT